MANERYELEKIARRKLTDKEYQKLQSVAHNEALLWCRAIRMADGKK